LSATLKELMREIVGRQLTSVTFVQDYIQLAFDGLGLTAYTQPTIDFGNRTLKWDQPGIEMPFATRSRAWFSKLTSMSRTWR
jgi:hypothetical protein